MTKFIQRKELQNIPKDVPPFGTVYTDYMFSMQYNEENGWHNPTISPYQDILISPSALVLHYAQSVFEGMKAYRNEEGGINLFRPLENFKRLNRSLERLNMPTLDPEFCLSTLKELLQIEDKWVYGEEGSALYIRPYVYATQPNLGVKPSNTYTFSIVLLPVGSYFSGEVKIWVEEQFVRAVKGGTGDVKFAGNYAASLLAISTAKQNGYNDVLWLDAETRTLAEEIGTMNVFFVLKDKVITPKLTGTILPGITRKSIIEMLTSWDIDVVEKDISIEELKTLYKQGEFIEVFGAGTAAVVTPITELVHRDFAMKFTYDDSLTLRIKEELVGIQRGRKEDKFNWIEKVK